MHRTVKIVQEFTPALEDGCFIVILVELIVDVLKANGFGIKLVCDPANTIRPHSLIRNTVLCGLPLFF